MAKYIKLFETHAEYESYITDSDKILPNVSYCKDNNEVHYNPWTDPRLIIKVVNADLGNRKICHNIALFSEMEIDGVVQPNVVQSYTFETIGEHTIKLTLLDPTSIGAGAFYRCDGLRGIIIPSSVTSIGTGAFEQSASLVSITSLATTAPTIDSTTFKSIHYDGTLYVPTGSTGYDVWMGSGYYYLGNYRWTKVEQ